MKDLIKETTDKVSAKIISITLEPRKVAKELAAKAIRQHLEEFYMQAVQDTRAVLEKMIEGMEATITRQANENARLVELVIETPIFPDEELAMLRSWFAELSDGSVLKLQQSNPAVHASLMAKITRVKKQEVVAA